MKINGDKISPVKALTDFRRIAQRRSLLAEKAQELMTEIQSLETERDELVGVLKKTHGLDLDASDKPESLDDAKIRGRQEAREALIESGLDGYLLIVDHDEGQVLFMFGGEVGEVTAMLQCLEASQPIDSPLKSGDFEAVFIGDVDVREIRSNGAIIVVEKI